MAISQKSKIITDIILCLLIVFVTYFQSLNRPWIFYDERTIYEELAVPVPSSFSEIFEVINSFGLVNNLSSTNYLYSSISVNRPSLFGVPFLLFIEFFLKKDPCSYHLLNLLLHMANTVFVYLIFRKILTDNRLLIVLLTSIWSVHPALSESVLLSTNIGATFSYLIFFILFYDFLKNKEKNNSTLRKFILPFCFLFPMLLNEYIIALPIIFFACSMIENLKSKNRKDSFLRAWQECQPYVFGLFIYLVYFFFFSNKFIQPSAFNSIIVFLERVLWLSPQIFVHALKLIFFPNILSIDESAHVKLGQSLFDPYSIFCQLVFILWIFLSFIPAKARIHLSALFLLSLLPFIQILTPTYCLFAERYLYLPVFFILFGVLKILSNLKARSKIIPIVLSVFLIFCLIRTNYRIKDWTNDFSLLSSTFKTSPNYLYKGLRLSDLARSNNGADKYFYKALKELKKERKKHSKEPIILKSYGLDYDSLLVKAVYFICAEAFSSESSDYKKYFKIFEPYVKFIDIFDPRTLELYANLLVKNNEIQKAKEVFLYANKKYPTSPFILISLIRFERGIEKDLISTGEYLKKARELYPYSKDILFETLRFYQLKNDLPGYTKHAYLYGLRTHLKFAYQEAVTGFIALGKLDRAKKTLDKLLILDPIDPRTLYLSGAYYIKKGDYQKAIEVLNELYLQYKDKSSDPKLSFDVAYTLATLYLAVGNTQEGISFAKEALNFAEGNSINQLKIKKLLKAYGL